MERRFNNNPTNRLRSRRKDGGRHFIRIFFTIYLSMIQTGVAFAVTADTITLNLKRPTEPSALLFDAEKGFWTDTYNARQRTLTFQNYFTLTHIVGGFGGEDVGDEMSYWDGFTVCTSGDSIDYGSMGNSDGWVTRQWGCMAGGGILTDADDQILYARPGVPAVEPGIPYLVAYWGYFYEEEGLHSLQVGFADGMMHRPIGVWICNHPWPYYGNVHGDGFATAFSEDGAFFSITAHGLNSLGEDTGVSVTHMLARYTEAEGLVQSPDWQWVDLTPLGNVSGIYFTMETSDADKLYGANTAVYFCMDRLQVYDAFDDGTPERPVNLAVASTRETSVTLEWESMDGAPGFVLSIDGEPVGESEEPVFTFTGLQAYTEYTLQVQARTDDGLLSDPAAIRVRTRDLTPPAAPSGLTAAPDRYSVDLVWEAAEDNVGIDRYTIYVNGVRETRTARTAFRVNGLLPDTDYVVEVEAADLAGNVSERARVAFRTLMLPPAQVEGLTATAHEYHIEVSWQEAENAATYDILVGDSLVGTTEATSFDIAPLEQATEYLISVVARNADDAAAPTTLVVSTLTDALAAPAFRQGAPSAMFDLGGRRLRRRAGGHARPAGIIVTPHRKYYVK